ncbi:MAG: type II toxin-antitoxin system YafQ family toxin [Bacteroides sp.]|uniref:type II toxin-antitoxin system YafQ family toxin n=1 Tax=Bacteroides sp. TaxID=29523 RepID=UPI0026E09304|nr:type II toxin-antitoxin system YafQ family toxin [Bacteroides sp.]MDO5420535.1 type II toxin-antitoxin system YafQ family toxin [Bacteroides sp.]
MSYRLEFTRQYLKDLKLARKRGLDEERLNEVIKKIMAGEKLPIKNRDHALSGNYEGFRECHIMPDWLLIYSLENTLKIVTLIRTGSHSDLF